MPLANPTNAFADTYPAGTVRALLETNLVTPATRAVLQARLAVPDAAPRFFADSDFYTLCAVLERLFAGPAAPTAREMALAIDSRLASGKSDGWRYSEMPPDTEAARLGLQGLSQTAQATHQADFTALTAEQQDSVLTAVQAGTAPGEIWRTLPGDHYFEDLLAEATVCYYSHPLAQEEIGYVGLADGQGWSKIRMNELEAWEPRPNTTKYDLPVIGAAKAEGATSSAPASQKYDLTETVDAVVIGTGAGGAPLMARLAAAGRSVVALDAGKFWDPARDFATDERSQEKLFWNDERLSAGGNPIAFGSNNSGIGVGGSTLHYTAYTPRAHSGDFRIHSEFGVGVDWPFGYPELQPYYTELEQFLGISGPSPYPWDAHDQPYPLAPLPLNGAAQLMETACQALGIKTSPAPNAALSAPYFQPGVGWRQACTNRGFCQAGCSVGAKASMDVTFIPVALQNGAEVRSECFATQIETDKSGAVAGVVYVQDGREHRQPCKNVFLCGGAIESPRLLLINKLANRSGQVGKNFMAHTAIQLWGQFSEDIRPYKGIPGSLISEDTHRPKDADFAGGYLLQSIGVMPVTYAAQFARAEGIWGQKLRDHMRGYNHVAGINICGDCLPYDHNYLELSTETDVRGLPKPRIHFTAGENEKRMTAHGEKIMRAIWDEAGAKEVWALERYAHIIGTCRLGDDPAASVVNADCQSHDVPGLYIVDNSVFPSALSVNPALTIMALSLRAADKFLSKSH